MARKLATVIKRLASRPDNDAFAAAPRPHDPADYARPELDGSGPAAADIPLAGTKPGASLAVWAPRTLDGCREPLAPEAPDLRGVWEVVEGRMKGHVERIEQAGNRITITVGGLVHDMFCDGTLENGVDDIAGFEGGRIRVAATFEGGVHKLRPFGKKVVAVTRRLDGDEMLWRYGPFRNRARRLDGPPFDHPATRAAAGAAGTRRGPDPNTREGRGATDRELRVIDSLDQPTRAPSRSLHGVPASSLCGRSRRLGVVRVNVRSQRGHWTRYTPPVVASTWIASSVRFGSSW